MPQEGQDLQWSSPVRTFRGRSRRPAGGKFANDKRLLSVAWLRAARALDRSLGLNPIEHSIGLLNELLMAKQRIEQRTSRLTISPELADTTGRTHLGPLLNINIAHGGFK